MAPLRSNLGRSGFDCVHNMLITGAAAEIPLKAVPDFFFRRMRVSFQNLFRRHDHARSAEAALKPMFIPESFLDGVQISVAREALNREHVFPVCLNGKHGARFHRDAIHGNGARATDRRFTTNVGARQPGYIADVVNQKEPRFHFVSARVPVQGDTDFSSHREFLVTRKRCSTPLTLPKLNGEKKGLSTWL
jgi:hypothetical protein